MASQTKSRPKGKNKRKRQSRPVRTAATADRHELYELSVQESECEVDLIEQVWSELRDRRCESIREDFCGTAAVCMEWVKRRSANTAIGVDINPEVLEWSRARVPERLTPEQASRMQLMQCDVMTVRTEPVDSVLAMNFSYYLLKDRELLRRYFKSVHRSLVDDGMFLLDAYGGSDSFVELEEERELDGFIYVWDQHSYNPINGYATNHIHFLFPDGSEMREAFTYHWRLWTLPEISEVLIEAGFRDVKIYWEGTDEETNEGNGEWFLATEGEACPGWVAYLVGRK